MSTKTNIDYSEFEEILKEEKQRVLRDIEALSVEVNQFALDDEIDDAVDMAELEVDNVRDQAVLKALKSELSEIEAALGRIRGGTYGVCEKTGKAIPYERLKANPWARTVVES